MPIGTNERISRRRFPVVTIAIVAVNSIVFLFEMLILFGGGQTALDSFVTAFGVVPAAVTQGQDILIPFYLTPLTSMFVHGGVAHIVFNMLFLLPFGDNVEDRLGHWLYLAFYLVSGLVAAFAQIAVDPASQVPSIGASGAIAGVLAGYLVLFPAGTVRVFVFLWLYATIARVPALMFIGFWFIIQFFSGVGSLGVQTTQTGGVAYWAHIGGFGSGLAMAFVHKWLSAQPERPGVAR
ncbi:MAG: rhomboid family intramembrane serine protease [Bacteroidetes bacterium]|nr:rhomboid family intramembrane serine protease [Bacteroidota bacterium]